MRKIIDNFHNGWGKRAVVIGVLDVITVCFAFFFALWLRFEFQFNAIPFNYLERYSALILPWCFISILVFAFFGLYNSVWSFASVNELFRVVGAYTVLALIELIMYYVLKIPMPRRY